MNADRYAAAAAVAVLMVAAAGCGGDSPTAKSTAASTEQSRSPASTSPAGTSSPSSQSTPSRKAVITPESVGAAPTLASAKGAIADLSDQRCATAKGTQTARGVLTSSAKKPARYLATVSWTTAEGDVLARGEVEVKTLAPGDSVPIKMSARVPSGAVLCVWGVERAAV